MDVETFNKINSIKNEIEYHNKKYHLEDDPEYLTLNLISFVKDLTN